MVDIVYSFPIVTVIITSTFFFFVFSWLMDSFGFFLLSHLLIDFRIGRVDKLTPLFALFIIIGFASNHLNGTYSYNILIDTLIAIMTLIVLSIYSDLELSPHTLTSCIILSLSLILHSLGYALFGEVVFYIGLFYRSIIESVTVMNTLMNRTTNDDNRGMTSIDRLKSSAYHYPRAVKAINSHRYDTSMKILFILALILIVLSTFIAILYDTRPYWTSFSSLLKIHVIYSNSFKKRN